MKQSDKLSETFLIVAAIKQTAILFRFRLGILNQNEFFIGNNRRWTY